tara:strand:+ start:5655 stop:6389 length:735 start_codon:yes stop_codon:yes gene_type:complete
MLLAIDIGNSHVVCAIYDSKKWIHNIRIPSNMNFWQKFSSLEKYDITFATISSVVPRLTPIYTEAIKNLFHIESLIIDHLNSNVELNVDSPNEVGADRICNSIAAKELFGCPAIVGDIGSATNYDVIDESGAFIGGAIAPGLKTAANNLIEKAALLKETLFTIPNNVVGKNTTTNLQSGIMLGAIDIIEGMFNRIETEMKWDKPYRIITGGFGKLISPNLEFTHSLAPNLTIEGIRIIHKRNTH